MKAGTIARDAAGLAGGLLISIGAGLLHVAAGLIVGGALLLAGALLASRVR